MRNSLTRYAAILAVAFLPACGLAATVVDFNDQIIDSTTGVAYPPFAPLPYIEDGISIDGLYFFAQSGSPRVNFVDGDGSVVAYEGNSLSISSVNRSRFRLVSVDASKVVAGDYSNPLTVTAYRYLRGVEAVSQTYELPASTGLQTYFFDFEPAARYVFSYQLLLDNLVFETDLSAPLPEPSAWILMIAGFGLVGGLARRRRVTLVA